MDFETVDKFFTAAFPLVWGAAWIPWFAARALREVADCFRQQGVTQ